ncbi:MAG: DNA polymerase III [Candidatus Harrisonbacteria bacterium CG10_big_fil_rev_8_21_14_0_10_42_17]|uniref:DNA polymerase beta n=1 Tax=Candidatus Harrisonbacteria bacterium CG10_big_fil_rev_8_21_14_0_10_42_17 TaxID=1974584 RepID=A0A2M6WI92_9BACT|nr:MAG: DNA polymerase III [Candidatus Harrisonbacteria bacterium CG10_big_fil_rev_8_21_14_0_10_42_17]
MISNHAVARILREIGLYLEMQDIPFKPRAYEKAAEEIESLSESVSALYKEGGVKALKELPAIGQAIAEKIEEYLTKGNIMYYEKLKKQIPVDLEALTGIEGLGPKKIKVLYNKLKIKNLKDLERNAKNGKIANLEGFGEKTASNILEGIEFQRTSGIRFILGHVFSDIELIIERLKSVRGVTHAISVGSARRMRETIGDADILVVAKKSLAVMQIFVSMPEVVRVFAQGSTKSSVQLKSGLQVDIRVVSRESLGAALNYFTGSKDHNVALRKIAIKKGWKLNEYGLYQRPTYRTGKQVKSDPPPSRLRRAGRRQGWKMIAGRDEEGLYKKLGLSYIEPELREMTGEIEAALRQAQGKHPGLPRLISYNALQGDLQIQTNWSDGAHSILEMAKAAHAQGLNYILITDHTKRLTVTHGLDARRIQQQWREIDSVNKKMRGKIKVLKGTECDILKNGTLDLPDSILSKLDVVGVSVHSFFALSKKEQTTRIVRAIQNPHVDILLHPTGRLLNKRPSYEVDMDEVIRVAKTTTTALEIDAFPERSDISAEYIKKCVNAGVKMSISSDAHATSHFAFLRYGVGLARCGWARKRDIINAWPEKKMKKMLK